MPSATATRLIGWMTLIHPAEPDANQTILIICAGFWMWSSHLEIQINSLGPVDFARLICFSNSAPLVKPSPTIAFWNNSFRLGGRYGSRVAGFTGDQ
jgi:hypothetical protein